MKAVKVHIIVIFVILLMFILPGATYAANTITVNTQQYATKNYTVITPNGSTKEILKVVNKDGANNNLYSLRSGLETGSNQDIIYRETYNLKTNATDVMNYYRNTLGYTGITNIEYNCILWIIDNMYLPGTDTETEREKLLRNAELTNSSLTNDDIEFVQQMALWYYTNADANGGDNSLSLLDTYSLGNATKIGGQKLSQAKADEIDKLYKYFIENAIQHVSDYGVGEIRDITHKKPTITVKSDTKKIQNDTTSNNTIIGPFTITKSQGNVAYNLDINVLDGNGQKIPKEKDGEKSFYIIKNLMNANQDITNLEEIVGTGEFYLKIPNKYGFNLTDVNLTVDVTYEKVYKTVATLIVPIESNAQPIVKIQRTEVTNFDMALRTYITAVNGKELPKPRIPEIDTSTIASQGMAKYKHRKDAVEVEQGNKITYKISAYNEGEINGIVTEIIEYLPDGLEFKISDNPEFIEYNSAGYAGTNISRKKICISI